MNMSDLQRINRHAQTHDAMSTLKYIKQLTKKEEYNDRFKQCSGNNFVSSNRWYIVGHHSN